jgi:hypothetical protein
MVYPLHSTGCYPLHNSNGLCIAYEVMGYLLFVANGYMLINGFCKSLWDWLSIMIPAGIHLDITGVSLQIQCL